ncbi:DUF2087 domain-containing protein [Clostridium sp. 19966]|uniref:DUF2087 domain-containing protein n=1 Tax=Clostridium sp. 19966 TaxID=2768166 RepID=UPI0028DDABBF|nr:DUF2087 domain-containing protein [Clostridium sp. 19966]MDT8717115.1 DUF2087 domain-containing protein [Clostridium sp. 19966]
MSDKLFLEADINEIKRGYSFDEDNGTYKCLICEEKFENGEIYPIEGRFFEAGRAVESHVEEKHGNMLKFLLEFDKKYTGITDNQKNLLKDFYEGMSDNDIAKKNGVSPATIRHQRFAFREKAKQAKAYLAIFELVESKAGRDIKEDLVTLHSGATMVDERYEVTNSEQDQIIRTYFDSLEPLRLKAFPTKEKRKIVVLRKISALFEPGNKYSEIQVNAILKPIHEDIATIRRYLIEYGFLERTRDCKEYWLKR